MSGESAEAPIRRETALAVAMALDSAPAVLWVFEGPTHVVLAANHAARVSVGDREVLLGRPLAHAVPELAGQELVRLLDRTVATRQPVRAAELPLKTTPAGAGEPTERLFSCVLTPYHNGAGLIAGVLAVMIDITGLAVPREPDLPGRPRAAQQRASTAEGDLPGVPGVHVAARHRALASGGQSSGDWFDAVPLSDGRLALVVGDVAESGPDPATAKTQLRSALVAYVVAGMAVDQVMRSLDQYVPHVPGGAGSTACLVVLDPSRRRLDYACAGHPPPMLVRASGEVATLAQPGGVPLGLGGGDYQAQSVVLGGEDSVLLYTDGAVPVAGAADRSGFELLRSGAKALAEPRLSVPQACRHIVDELVAHGRPRDDLVVLAARLHRVRLAPLRLTIPARADQLSRVRRGFREWLHAAGASQQDMEVLQLTVGEALTNSIEHAYPPGEAGVVELVAVIEADGTVQVDVCDRGQWREPPRDRGTRGRGLLLMRECLDALEVVPSTGSGPGSGTTVRMRHRLRGTDVLDTEAGPEPPEPPPTGQQVASDIRIDYVGDGVHVRLSGDLDARSVPTLGRELSTLTCGGTVPLSVDLSGLDYLSSAGVTLLFELAKQASTAGARLHLFAEPAGPVAFVLANTGLHTVAEVVTGAGDWDGSLL